MSALAELRKRRCVFGCDILAVHVVPLHRFPHPNKEPTLFDAWLSAVGDKLDIQDRQRIYTNKRVCDYHFMPKEKTAAGRIIKSAVPSLHLTGVRQSTVTFLESDHSYCRPRRDGPSESVFVETPTPIASTSHTCNVIPAITPSSSQIPVIEDPDLRKILQDKERNFTKEERRLKNEIIRLRQKNKAFKRHCMLKKEKSEKIKLFHKFCDRVPDSAKLFIRMQVQESHKKKKGRRFSLEEKILCLSFFKNSPKDYKLMCKHFTLPSRKTLKSLVAKIKISPGINDVIFKHLKKTVRDMTIEDRLCNILFDEMSISPQLLYRNYSDELMGFEDYGGKRTSRIANHVLVFMVKGVKKNYKQPVAYYFTQNLTTIKLKELIIEVITKVQSTGLDVLCTVCDQSGTNVSAINSLISEAKAHYLTEVKEWKREVIVVNGKEIIPLYDIPHLLKGLRNNLLNKDLKYTMNNSSKIIKWNYIQQVYQADKAHGELRMLYKLSDEHVDPTKIRKMRVKNAAQVFSHSLAVATDNLVARGDVPEECQNLVPFVLLIDKLFDSLNAGTYNILNGKIYRAAVKQNSPHHALWQDAIKMLKSVKYLKQNRDGSYTERSVPTVNNLIKTIEGFKEIWKKLRCKYLFDAMLTRNFNQDPLENFFGSIRSVGVRNVAPNCVSFEGAFKTLLLNNFSSHHSVNSNCESDTNSCLESLKFYLTENNENTSSHSHCQHIVVDQPLQMIGTDPESEESNVAAGHNRAYVCGWVLTKCLGKVIKGCQHCKSKLLSNDKDSEAYQYIRSKEYNKRKTWLCYPSKELILYFKEIQNVTISFLQSDCHEKSLKERIKSFINIFVDLEINCDEHANNFKNCFMDISMNIIIYSWCRHVNRILTGKMTYIGEDPVKNAAQNYCNKYKKRSN